MKRNLSALSGILLLIIPAAQAQFTYNNNSGTLTLTDYTGAGGAVTIPAAINGLTVTGISYEAFWGKEELTSVTIPDSVSPTIQFISDPQWTNYPGRFYRLRSP